MKIVKTTHYRGADEFETTDFTWFESDDLELLRKKLIRLGQLLHDFEGLKCIAADPKGYEACFAEGLSKNAYWVRVSIQ